LENAWLGRGNAFLELERYGDAISAYDKALALNGDLVSAEGARFFAKKSVCDWTGYSTECDHLAASVLAKRASTNPFAFVAISPSPEDQLQCTNCGS
jgi:tetratricopeptide (TPR) repeat protein